MNYTAYHKLQKPLNTEKYNIDIHNTNADIIDSALNLLRQNDISQNNALNSEIERAIERENEIDHKISSFDPDTDWKESIQTPVFDDSISTFSTLSAANTAAETASNDIQSNKNLFATLSNIKKSFSAMIQSLKFLASNVGAIHGITSDISENSENIAASIKAVHQLNCNLGNIEFNGVEQKLKICANTVLKTVNSDGTVYIDLPTTFSVPPHPIVNVLGITASNTGTNKNQLSVYLPTIPNQAVYIKYIVIGY